MQTCNGAADNVYKKTKVVTKTSHRSLYIYLYILDTYAPHIFVFLSLSLAHIAHVNRNVFLLLSVVVFSALFTRCKVRAYARWCLGICFRRCNFCDSLLLASLYYFIFYTCRINLDGNKQREMWDFQRKRNGRCTPLN